MYWDTSKIKNIVFGVLLAIGFFSFGIYMGLASQPEVDKVSGLEGKETAVSTNADFSPFWKVWNTLKEKHPDSKVETDQERVYGAISGLVDSLDDPYTVFFTPDDAKVFEEDIAGNFSGVGMEVGVKNKILTVISPLKNTPADKAGIKSGDKILKIEEKSTLGISVDEAIKLIRGEKGTAVTLSIMRKGFEKEKDFKIVRDIINVPVIDTELRGDNIFVIHLYSFSANSVNLFRNALKEFADARTDKLLLDLRGNPGGYLSAAIDMSSWFLPGGKTVVIEDYGDDREQKIYRSYGYDIFNDNLKFVILINEGSASASEILAGAMQDYGKAILVGEKSFGKGSVQEVVKVTPETLLKVTIARWLTPNGTSISKKGLVPDYEVKSDKSDNLVKRDPQMEKAIELLNNWPGINKEN